MYYRISFIGNEEATTMVPTKNGSPMVHFGISLGLASARLIVDRQKV
jgi:hypothetical protein